MGNFAKNASLPATQGIKYAGSKLKLLPHILTLCQQTKSQTVFDGFSGSTRVSQALAQSGYRVHSNDISVWSKVLASCFLKTSRPRSHYQELMNHLNHLNPCDGWFTHNYGGSEKDIKKPWQVHNTQKLDAIRDEIDQLGLDKMDRNVALTSLLLAMDEVDNTLGHHVSYLRKWSKRSFKNLHLSVPNYIQQEDPDFHTVTQSDIFDSVMNVDADLAYFDPPYGSNNEKMPPSRVRYAAYYHLWTTICNNDRPELFGKAGRRKDSSDDVAASVFEDFRSDETGRFRVITAIEKLLKMVSCEWIVLSYSSGGRATADQLQEIIDSVGNLHSLLKIDYRKHVMAAMTSSGEWLKECEHSNQEYLFLIQKK